MFKNIGKKIKTLALVLCWIGIGISILSGGILIISGISQLGSYYKEPATVQIVIGIVTILLGSLFSWLGSFFAYGFGELVDKVTQIELNTRSDYQK